MSWVLLCALVLVTVASRVLPMSLLPELSGEPAEVVAALPAPLFAALAAVALLGGAEPPSPAVLVAVAAAVPGALRRSLALTLAGGLAGFVLTHVLL